jgi:uncharacterized protein YjeT (DUF2065 family)
VRVVEGLLKLGTPLCVQKIVTTTDDEGRTRNRKEMLYIGKITSLQVHALFFIIFSIVLGIVIVRLLTARHTAHDTHNRTITRRSRRRW